MTDRWTLTSLESHGGGDGGRGLYNPIDSRGEDRWGRATFGLSRRDNGGGRSALEMHASLRIDHMLCDDELH